MTSTLRPLQSPKLAFALFSKPVGSSHSLINLLRPWISTRFPKVCTACLLDLQYITFTLAYTCRLRESLVPAFMKLASCVSDMSKLASICMSRPSCLNNGNFFAGCCHWRTLRHGGSRPLCPFSHRILTRGWSQNSSL